MVHACEWNPDAAEALKRNLRLNGVEDRCVVHHGDNREVSRGPQGGEGRGDILAIKKYMYAMIEWLSKTIILVFLTFHTKCSLCYAVIR